MAVGWACFIHVARIPGLALINAEWMTQNKRASGRDLNLGWSQFSVSFKSGIRGRGSKQGFIHAFSGNQVVPTRGEATHLLGKSLAR